MKIFKEKLTGFASTVGMTYVQLKKYLKKHSQDIDKKNTIEELLEVKKYDYFKIKMYIRYNNMIKKYSRLHDNIVQ